MKYSNFKMSEGNGESAKSVSFKREREREYTDIEVPRRGRDLRESFSHFNSSTMIPVTAFAAISRFRGSSASPSKGECASILPMPLVPFGPLAALPFARPLF